MGASRKIHERRSDKLDGMQDLEYAVTCDAFSSLLQPHHNHSRVASLEFSGKQMGSKEAVIMIL